MRSLIRWFVENHVAAMLLMVALVIGGLISFGNVNRVLFPTVQPGLYEISMPYRGAGPREIEERILVRIEEAIHDVEGVKKIWSRAREGYGWVTVETRLGTDEQEFLNNLKTRIDAINTFPPEAEIPRVREITFRNRVISVAVAGEVDDHVLANTGREIRDEIARLPGISIVNAVGVRNREISIEVSEESLRKYGLTFDDVARAVRSSSLDLPAGKVRAAGGDIELKTRGQAYSPVDFEELVVLKRPDGTRVHVRDVANVKEDFEEGTSILRFNGQRSVLINVREHEGIDIIDVSRAVNKYVDEAQDSMPEGVELAVWVDNSRMFDERISMLVKNAGMGLILVFLVLFLFLRPKVALWVSVGIGISFIAPFVILPFTDTTINMITTFAFLLILGIVVDDAIIVGESIHHAHELGDKGKEASILGAQRVVKPVMFAAGTTMIVFGVMYFLPGEASKTMGSIATIVILVLLFSLIECFLILPRHLCKMKPLEEVQKAKKSRLMAVQDRFASGLQGFCEGPFRRLLNLAVQWRYATIALFVMVFVLAQSIVSGGWIKQGFNPSFSVDFIVADIQMPEGTSEERMAYAARRVEEGAFALKNEMDAYLSEGEKSVIKNIQIFGFGSNVTAVVETEMADRAPVDMQGMTDIWRERIGLLPDVLEFNISFTNNNGDADLYVKMASEDPETIEAALETVKAQVASYNGVAEVGDLKRGGQTELALKVKPEADSLGLSLSDIARQVRQAFYGEEVQRIPRGREDIRVYVRYSEDERRSVQSLEDMRIRDAQGNEVPFGVVADADYTQGYAYIRREDRLRTNLVWANLKEEGMTASEIMDDLKENHYPKWEKEYPGLQFGVAGFQEEQAEFVATLGRLLFFALIIVYSLMAVAFRSYSQPLVILSIVPFAYMGMIFGHLIMGLEINMATFFGVLAAGGVVINDNLVLVDYINRLRDQGQSVWDAIIDGAVSRFRPIILTSVTTFVGLFPIMLERGMHAAFLHQMVAGLSFGVMFAVFVTLLLVPSLIAMGQDLRKLPGIVVYRYRRLMHKLVSRGDRNVGWDSAD